MINTTLGKLRSAGVSERSVGLAGSILSVCGGGTFISNEVGIIGEVSSVLFGPVPLCATRKNGVPLPSVIYVPKSHSRSEQIPFLFSRYVDANLDRLKELDAADGLMTRFFMTEVASGFFHFLPYQNFSIFGIPKNASEFLSSREERQKEILNRMSGRVRNHKVVGIYFGIQDTLPDRKRSAAPPPPPADPRIKRAKRVEATAAQMIKSASISASKAIVNTVTGKPVFASLDEQSRRKTICEGDGNEVPPCEFFIKNQGRCSKCGCFANFKRKLISEGCPVGKW